jgi:hypothetical protein
VSRPPSPLPPPFDRIPFGTGAALASGITSKRLRSGDLEQPFRGVNRRRGASDSLRERCAAFMVRMPPGGFFCGPTAALLLGVPLPLRLETDRLLHIGVMRPHRAIRVTGTIGHKFEIAPHRIRRYACLPVTDPARTWRDLAPYLGLADLVAAGDFLVSGDPSHVDRASLERELRSAAGARGMKKLTAALPLLDGRAESRAESHLRVALVQRGVTGFASNYWVTLREPWTRYRIDIAFPRQMVGIEYQSECHHDPDQWRKDMTRLSRLRAAGWSMTEVSKDDLADPDELARRVRALLASSR